MVRRRYATPPASAVWVLGTALAAMGCSGGNALNPQPIPVPGDDFEFDTTKVAMQSAGEAAMHAVSIAGAPGALSRGGGSLSAFDLNSKTRAQAVVDSDGSFAVTFAGSLDDVIRLSAIHTDPASGGIYLASVELQTKSGRTTPTQPGACAAVPTSSLLVAPSTPLGATSSLSVTIGTGCTTPVTASIAWISSTAFAVTSASTVTIAAGGNETLAVAFAPSSPGMDAEVIVFGSGGPPTSLAVFGLATP